MTYRWPTLADVIATLEVDRVDDNHFVATQLDNPAHHIVGGRIAGQALMAASLTAPGRKPHSVHVYYIRAGDARLMRTISRTTAPSAHDGRMWLRLVHGSSPGGFDVKTHTTAVAKHPPVEDTQSAPGQRTAPRDEQVELFPAEPVEVAV